MNIFYTSTSSERKKKIKQNSKFKKKTNPRNDDPFKIDAVRDVSNTAVIYGPLNLLLQSQNKFIQLLER